MSLTRRWSPARRLDSALRPPTPERPQASSPDPPNAVSNHRPISGLRILTELGGPAQLQRDPMGSHGDAKRLLQPSTRIPTHTLSALRRRCARLPGGSPRWVWWTQPHPRKRRRPRPEHPVPGSSGSALQATRVCSTRTTESYSLSVVRIRYSPARYSDVRVDSTWG